jgi:serine/threonine protein kinase
VQASISAPTHAMPTRALPQAREHMAPSTRRSFDRVLGQTVAVKVIKVSEQDQDEVESIHHEITTLAGCNHPNIVKYLVGVRSHHTA